MVWLEFCCFYSSRTVAFVREQVFVYFQKICFVEWVFTNILTLRRVIDILHHLIWYKSLTLFIECEYYLVSVTNRLMSKKMLALTNSMLERKTFFSDNTLVSTIATQKWDNVNKSSKGWLVGIIPLLLFLFCLMYFQFIKHGLT